MRTAKRVLSGVLLVAVVIGAVAIALLLRPVEGPSADGQQAAQGASGYPAPPEGTPPPSPEGWYVPEATATLTSEPIVQTAEAVMALPTWTPLPTATATLVPTPVPTLGGDWSVALLSGREERSGRPMVLRLVLDDRGEPSGEHAFLDTGFLTGGRTAIIDMRPSPDGRTVLVNTAHGEGNATWLLDVPSGQFGHGVFHPFGDWLPIAWHPDGQRVLVVTGFSLETARVALLDIETEDPEMVPMPFESPASSVVKPLWQLVSASFSPGGDRVVLAFSDDAGQTNGSEVWITDLNGDGMLLAASESHVSHVSWSPRGEWIAVREERPEQTESDGLWSSELRVLRPDGSESLRVGPTIVGIGDPYGWAPQWSHSGERLAYFGGVGPARPGQRNASIEIWEAATAETRTLVPQGRGGVHGLVWAPDDRALWYVATPSDEPSVAQVHRVGADDAGISAAFAGPSRDALSIRLDIRSQALWLSAHHEDEGGTRQ